MDQQFSVIKPGPFTTVQDEGRYGYQKFGVPVTGVLDSFAAKVANILVGNCEDLAVLEFTFLGSEMKVLKNADLSVTGSKMPVKVNGAEFPMWSSFKVKTGDVITIGQAQKGCRGYLAVTGGIEVPVVMDSRSCYVGAKIGGLHGRHLIAGDVLMRGSGELLNRQRKLPVELIPEYPSEIVIRAIAGPQDDYFDEGLEFFFNSFYTVSPQANRMGYRLQGPIIEPGEGLPKSIISEPSLPGGVQVPEDGQPIILLVEQTVGGYSKIATVISSDISKIAQAVPGDRIRFKRIDLQTAYQIKADERQFLNSLEANFKSAISTGDQIEGSSLADLINMDPEYWAELLNRHLLQI